MSVISVSAGPPITDRLHFMAGALVVEKSAADAVPAYNMAGTLYYSSASGYLLLSVPNAFVRGVFSAMREPGIELPPGHNGAPMSAHITVMRDSEVEQVGGPEKLTERGKQFHYSIGRIVTVEPEGWPDVSKAWLVRVHSPELQKLRRSYGLSGRPNGGKHDYHLTVAVRKKGVLGRNQKSKAS